MAISAQEAKRKRDAKVRATLSNFAPIWLVGDEYRPREDAVLFNLVFVNPVYGWVNNRMKYDAFNDVLYHMGERRLTEDETLPLQDETPYIDGEVATRVPNSPEFLSRPAGPKA